MTEQHFLDIPTKTESPQNKVEENDGNSSYADASTYTRIVCMSDTHGRHRDISVPNGDILIHAGDFTNLGEPHQVEDLSRLFDSLRRPQGQQEARSFRRIVCIAGNHDITFQPAYYARAKTRFHRRRFLDDSRARSALTNCTYLLDESCTVQITAGDGSQRGEVKIYGSPWQPEFYDWAFNLPRGEPCHKVWRNIPPSTDVLVTHGPPLGRGDLCKDGEQRAGCYDLLREIQSRVKPRLHIFGHIHEGYGVSFDGTTMYVNASNMTFHYQPYNPCIVIDLPHDKTKPAVLVQPSSTLSPPEVIEWLKCRNFHRLVPYFESASPQVEGRDLIIASDGSDSFLDICYRLLLHREPDVRRDLGRALLRFRAESYTWKECKK